MWCGHSCLPRRDSSRRISRNGQPSPRECIPHSNSQIVKRSRAVQISSLERVDGKQKRQRSDAKTHAWAGFGEVGPVFALEVRGDAEVPINLAACTLVSKPVL